MRKAEGKTTRAAKEIVAALRPKPPLSRRSGGSRYRRRIRSAANQNCSLPKRVLLRMTTSRLRPLARWRWRVPRSTTSASRPGRTSRRSSSVSRRCSESRTRRVACRSSSRGRSSSRSIRRIHEGSSSAAGRRKHPFLGAQATRLHLRGVSPPPGAQASRLHLLLLVRTRRSPIRETDPGTSRVRCAKSCSNARPISASTRASRECGARREWVSRSITSDRAEKEAPRKKVTSGFCAGRTISSRRRGSSGRTS